MIVGVLRETKADERRVALTPSGAQALIITGHQVIVEHGAGAGAGLPDEAYLAQGAAIAASACEVIERSQLVLKVKEPTLDEARALRTDQIVFSYLHLAAEPELTDALLASGATCIAYETVTNEHGRLPLLAPMSEIAGRLAAQAAAWALLAPNGGPGALIGGAPGVAAARVLVLGGGSVGSNAARIAAGMGADVLLYDASPDRLRELDTEFASTAVGTRAADPLDLEAELPRADAVIGAVLQVGAKAPRLISREQLHLLAPGSVLVDVSIDQGGCFATSRATTHGDPVFTVDGILHYCVPNMPGAVPRTATRALTASTLRYVLRIADGGLAAVAADAGLRGGVNVAEGKVQHPAVADALALPVA
jgi:alanine dehydrogenase